MTGPVVVRLRGGLGNQMFQYATAFALAQRRGSDVQYDGRELAGAGAPQLMRWQLALQPVRRTLALRYPRPVLALARRKRWFAALWGCHAETGLRFDPALLARRAPLYLDGYFQSERYFADAAAALRQQFQPRAAWGPAAMAHRAAIERTPDSVAIHVRRGDYVHVAANRAVHGICEAAYYEAAARLVVQRTGASRFFVFSDDMAWARATLKLPGPCVHVDSCADRPEFDLSLMSRCRHHVCANSSFGWWGAWLGAHGEQVVVAPRRWFRAPHLDAGDIVPARWLRL